jgi:hypothetical protein
MAEFAYKLFRVLKSGEITSLFINKTERLKRGVWLEAKCYPTDGYKVRPFWHCTKYPIAPHLTIKGRVWVMVEMENYTEFNRPVFQGGKWFLAKRIKILDDNTINFEIEKL